MKTRRWFITLSFKKAKTYLIKIDIFNKGESHLVSRWRGQASGQTEERRPWLSWLLCCQARVTRPLSPTSWFTAFASTSSCPQHTPKLLLSPCPLVRGMEGSRRFSEMLNVQKVNIQVDYSIWFPLSSSWNFCSLAYYCNHYSKIFFIECSCCHIALNSFIFACSFCLFFVPMLDSEWIIQRLLHMCLLSQALLNTHQSRWMRAK